MAAPRFHLALIVVMALAYAADSLWVKPRRRHLDFLSSRDCAFQGRCWIR